MSLLNNCSQIAWKILSSVEIDNYGSNQHELHGAVAFKKIFGTQRQYLTGDIFYINNSIQKIKTDLTWYDARENNPERSEFRFYYTHEISVFHPSIGDILMLTRDSNNRVLIFIINNQNIKKQILDNRTLFTSYDYQNGSSYYANLVNVPFLTNLI